MVRFTKWVLTYVLFANLSVAGCAESTASVRREMRAEQSRCDRLYMEIAEEAPSREVGRELIAAAEVECAASLRTICERNARACHD